MADYTIDAKDKRLGRLATEIATILQGKKRTDYAQNKVGGDRVLLKNVEQIVWTGQKGDQRIYYRHTGYMGHVKEQTLAERKAKDPYNMLRETVRHMLPKNFLNTPRMKNLVFINEAGTVVRGPKDRSGPKKPRRKAGGAKGAQTQKNGGVKNESSKMNDNG